MTGTGATTCPEHGRHPHTPVDILDRRRRPRRP